MKAHDIMTANPVCVTPESAVRDAARVMQRENVGVVPVVDDVGSKRLLGVLTDRDIAIRAVAEGRGLDVTVSEIMTRNVTTCRSEDDVDALMRTMGEEQIRRIPVVDEAGALVGIIAQADLVLSAPNEQKVERTIEKISQPSGKHAG